jgi:hypothetical protein
MDRIWISSSVTHCSGVAVTSSSALSRGRAETYFDPVNAHIDPVDQGNEDNTPACCGEVGPALSDLLGSRGKPPLGGRIREPRGSRLIDVAGIEEPLPHSADHGGHLAVDLKRRAGSRWLAA